MSDMDLESGGSAVNEDICELGLRNEDQTDSLCDVVEPSIQNMINESASAFSLSPQKELSDDSTTGSIEMNLENNGIKRKLFSGLVSDTVNPGIKTDTFMRYAHDFLSDLDVVPTIQDLAEMDIVDSTETLVPIFLSEKTENTDVNHATQNLQHTMIFFDEEIPVANNEVVIGCENEDSDSDSSQTETGGKSGENMSVNETTTKEDVYSESGELNFDQGTKTKVNDDPPEFDTDDTAKNKIDDPVSQAVQKIVKKANLREPVDEIEFMYDDTPLATLLIMFPDGKIKYPIIRCENVRKKGFVEVDGTFKMHEQPKTGKAVSKLSDAVILQRHERVMFPHGAKNMHMNLVDLKDTCALDESGEVALGNLVSGQLIQRRTSQRLKKNCSYTPVVALRAQKKLVLKSKRRTTLKKKVRGTEIAAQTFGDGLKDDTTEAVDSASVEVSEKRDATAKLTVCATEELPVPEPSSCSGVSYLEPDWIGPGDVSTGIGEGELSRVGKINLHAPILVSRLLPTYAINDPQDYSKPPCWLQRFLDETKRREEWKMRRLITFQRDFISLETERMIKLENIFQAVLKPKNPL